MARKGERVVRVFAQKETDLDSMHGDRASRTVVDGSLKSQGDGHLHEHRRTCKTRTRLAIDSTRLHVLSREHAYNLLKRPAFSSASSRHRALVHRSFVEVTAPA